LYLGWFTSSVRFARVSNPRNGINLVPNPLQYQNVTCKPTKRKKMTRIIMIIIVLLFNCLTFSQQQKKRIMHWEINQLLTSLEQQLKGKSWRYLQVFNILEPWLVRFWFYLIFHCSKYLVPWFFHKTYTVEIYLKTALGFCGKNGGNSISKCATNAPQSFCSIL